MGRLASLFRGRDVVQCAGISYVRRSSEKKQLSHAVICCLEEDMERVCMWLVEA